MGHSSGIRDFGDCHAVETALAEQLSSLLQHGTAVSRHCPLIDLHIIMICITFREVNHVDHNLYDENALSTFQFLPSLRYRRSRAPILSDSGSLIWYPLPALRCRAGHFVPSV